MLKRKSPSREQRTKEPAGFETSKFINPAQVGGIESYTLDDGAGRGVRALCVNTGGGLRYRVLIDRGLDIDQAFFNQHSLAFLTHNGPSAPNLALDRGIEWLKSFPGGLLTSCGPLNVGAPGVDEGEDLGLHGAHSNSPAVIESIINPDPRAGRMQMSIVGVIRYGRLFNPCIELRRTITSTLGSNVIEFTDAFFNAGNKPVPHAWLLHINFGYPLVDEGAELCFDAAKIEPLGSPDSHARFRPGVNYKRVPGPLDLHRGSSEYVAHIYPRAVDRSGKTTVGIVNRRLSVAAAIHYNIKEFPRLANWQHFGPGEYVTALEPVNGGVTGRWQDRAAGRMDTLEAGARKTYRYAIEVVTDRDGMDALRKLNDR